MEKHVKAARFLAHLFDAQFGIGNFRFGILAIIDLIPGIGDVIAAVISFYIVWVGIKLELPAHRILQMFFNVLIDFLIGLVPVIGDVGYVFYKANIRNMAIIEMYIYDKNNTNQKKLIG